ncbi:MAG: oligosaccharide flippase family protein [Desulfovibrionaceae bacterium]|nr:oligosaccharide flippase family protein [Desulfovibrionaceae bacterium]
MRIKDIPKRLGFILGAQWTRDLTWTVFTITLARHSQDILGQIVLALTYGYLVKTLVDVGLNDYLSASFARGDSRPKELLSEVTWLKFLVFLPVMLLVFLVTQTQGYTQELTLIVLAIAAGLGLDAICDSFFVLCQARGRQDVEMRIRIPSALIGIGFGIMCVLLACPPICIALYKPIESLLCLIFALKSLAHNPLKRFGLKEFYDLTRKMRAGLIFTLMAFCAMFYNKINVIFLKQYGTDALVGGYGVAWETIEGVSTLVSGALLGKVLFPLLTKLYTQDVGEFKKLAARTAKALWGAALPLIFLLYVESDRFLTLVYGANFAVAVPAQQLLTPCIATAFLHNLAAYVMIGMGQHVLLCIFYVCGLLLNIGLCFFLIPLLPLEGAALSLTLTKVAVAIGTIGYFQAKVRPLKLFDWLLLISIALVSFGLYSFLSLYFSREVAEIAGLCPLLGLFWAWRPPAPFEHAKS